jgi:hypothetical protein
MEEKQWRMMENELKLMINDNIYEHDRGKLDIKKIDEKKSWLVFPITFNKYVPHIPNNILHISFGKGFSQPLGSLPNNLITLIFGENFNENINKLPESLVYLIFGDNYNRPLKFLHTMINLEELKFGYSFNCPIDKLDTLIKLRKLTFGDKFNCPIINLPLNLKTLIFGESFNQYIDNVLPASIEYLKFGTNFTNGIISTQTLISMNYFIDKDILDKLKNLKKLHTKVNVINNIEIKSDSITKLELTFNYNSRSLNLITKNLRDVKIYGYIAKNYSTSILGNLPNGIKKLTIDCKYELHLENLPNSLESLTLGRNLINESLDNLPENLLELIIEGKSIQSLNNLPKSINRIIFPFNSPTKNKIKLYCTNEKMFRSCINKIKNPNDITINLNKMDSYLIKKINQQQNPFIFTTEDKFWLLNKLNDNKIKQKDEVLTKFKEKVIPSGYYEQILGEKLPELKLLVLSNIDFNCPIDNLPKKLKLLILSNCFNQPVDNLPDKLKYLEFGKKFNKSVEKLPESLKYLIFGEFFNQSIDNLPKNLEYLKFNLSYSFNKSVDKLPISLTHLYFPSGGFFNQSLDNLPISLEEISINRLYNRKITNIGINIKYLILHGSNPNIIVGKMPWGGKILTIS